MIDAAETLLNGMALIEQAAETLPAAERERLRGVLRAIEERHVRTPFPCVEPPDDQSAHFFEEAKAHAERALLG